MVYLAVVAAVASTAIYSTPRCIPTRGLAPWRVWLIAEYDQSIGEPGKLPIFLFLLSRAVLLLLVFPPCVRMLAA
mgnify:CR=1 FL=1